MKKIKLLQQRKDDLLAEEQRTYQVTYQSQTDKIEYSYSFSETRERIRGIDSEIRKLKHLLNYSNATTIVADFDITLGECLVYMSQLNNEKERLEWLARKEPKERRSTINGVIEYTELNYDKAECRKELTATMEKVANLQISIDRTNLTNMIEVE
jgi:hypothetical protein